MISFLFEVRMFYISSHSNIYCCHLIGKSDVELSYNSRRPVLDNRKRGVLLYLHDVLDMYETLKPGCRLTLSRPLVESSG